MGKNKINSELIKLGSDPSLHHGSLSDPIYKTSTIIFNDYKSFLDAKKNKFKKPYYGRFGNYSVKRFQELICPVLILLEVSVHIYLQATLNPFLT